VHGAQDSSSFILLHEHSKVFKIIYTNCPGNVFPGKVLSGKRPLPQASCLRSHLSTLWSDVVLVATVITWRSYCSAVWTRVSNVSSCSWSPFYTTDSTLFFPRTRICRFRSIGLLCSVCYWMFGVPYIAVQYDVWYERVCGMIVLSELYIAYPVPRHDVRSVPRQKSRHTKLQSKPKLETKNLTSCCCRLV